jgi:hypothetical protein
MGLGKEGRFHLKFINRPGHTFCTVNDHLSTGHIEEHYDDDICSVISYPTLLKQYICECVVYDSAL